MQRFFEDFSFIIAFMVMVLIISMAAGKEVTNKFLALVLFSMVIVNSDKIVSFLNFVTKDILTKK